jgi:hypothetical protein
MPTRPRMGATNSTIGAFKYELGNLSSQFTLANFLAPVLENHAHPLTFLPLFKLCLARAQFVPSLVPITPSLG